MRFMDEKIFDSIVLRSPSDKYRFRIEASDEGALMVMVLVRSLGDPDRWEPQPHDRGRKRLALAARDSNFKQIINLS